MKLPRYMKYLVPIFIFALAVATRLTFYIAYQKNSLGDPLYGEVMAMARSLIRQGTFADAFGPGTGPTAHSTPLYPLLAGAIFKLVGDDPIGYTTIRVLTCLSAATSYALLPHLSQLFGFSWTAGVLGGLAGALVPYWTIELDGEFENVVATATFITILMYIKSYISDLRRRGFSAVFVGLLIGIGSLFGATFLPAFIVMVAELVKGRFTLQTLRFVSLVACGFLIALSPWIFRNYLVFGSFIPLRGNFWLEVAVSNQDGASATFERNYANRVHHRVHPYNNRKEKERYVQLGERAYMAEKSNQSLRWITENPIEFFSLVLKRLWNVLFFNFDNLYLNLFCGGVVLCGIAGIVINVRRQFARQNCLFYAKLISSFLVVHVLVQVAGRYRYPIHVLMLVPFGSFAVLFLQRLFGVNIETSLVGQSQE